MSKKNIDRSVESRVCFEQLEEWVREQIQFYVQELLEDEVTQLLGRRKNERRREVDAPGGYRNGYGKERRLTLSCGTIKLRRPRVRDLEERFESRVLPLFAKRTQEVRDLIPELYLHGLAEGDFDLALRGATFLNLRAASVRSRRAEKGDSTGLVVRRCCHARAVIWKMLLVAEKRFRRLKAPHLMKDVYQGAQYVNGVPVNQVTEEKAA